MAMNTRPRLSRQILEQRKVLLCELAMAGCALRPIANSILTGQLMLGGGLNGGGGAGPGGRLYSFKTLNTASVRVLDAVRSPLVRSVPRIVEPAIYDLYHANEGSAVCSLTVSPPLFYWSVSRANA